MTAAHEVIARNCKGHLMNLWSTNVHEQRLETKGGRRWMRLASISALPALITEKRGDGYMVVRSNQG